MLVERWIKQTKKKHGSKDPPLQEHVASCKFKDAGLKPRRYIQT
jgi:hypothetical protein